MPTTYTAAAAPPASDVTVSVVAASVTDPTKTASANVTFPAISVSVSPGTATLQAGVTMQLAASVAACLEPSVRDRMGLQSC